MRHMLQIWSRIKRPMTHTRLKRLTDIREDIQTGKNMCNHLKLASLLFFNCYILSVNGVQDGDIRLVNGGLKTEGRVEIYYSGVWGTVCDDQFSSEEAEVICRQLGFKSYVRATHRAHFGEGEGPIWMDGLKCKRNGKKLSACVFNGWGINDCDHKEDAGVVCLKHDELSRPDLAIRLSCPPSITDGNCKVCAEKQTICSEGTVSAVKGVVEVETDDGVWYPISNKSWSEKTARVVCGQLGYPDLIDIPTLSEIWPTHKTHFCYGRNLARCTPAGRYKRRLRKTVLADSLDCSGLESNIGQCKDGSFNPFINTTVSIATIHCGYQNAENTEECFSTLSTSQREIYRLRAGVIPSIGRVEVRKNGEWGTICDFGWDFQDASIICRNLGYGSAKTIYTGSSFGRGIDSTHYSELKCIGFEQTLDSCNSDISTADRYCPSHIGDVGVECNIPQCEKPPTSRITTDDVIEINGVSGWGSLCDSSANIDAANVICRESKVLFAKEITISSDASGSTGILYDGTIQCTGDEPSLKECKLSLNTVTSCQKGVMIVMCSAELPDLVPNLDQFEGSLRGRGYINFIDIRSLTCAREEKCLASSANGQEYGYRNLLRFDSLTMNYGTADFAPALDRANWIWHSCHNHYHSYENFITYDVLNTDNVEVAEGHKASFCLEDTTCDYGGYKRYSCATGYQGISKNCGDLYYNGLDCQWIDITDNGDGVYLVRQTVNAERLTPETDYKNNEIECEIRLNPVYNNQQSFTTAYCHHSDH